MLNLFIIKMQNFKGYLILKCRKILLLNRKVHMQAPRKRAT